MTDRAHDRTQPLPRPRKTAQLDLAGAARLMSLSRKQYRGTCCQCGTVIWGPSNLLYCSNACRQAAYRIRRDARRQAEVAAINAEGDEGAHPANGAAGFP